MLIDGRIEKRPYEYYNRTQVDANGLPPYMRGRKEKYSVYQQVINMMNVQFDQVEKALVRHQRNRLPQTFLGDTIDVIYLTGKEDIETLKGLDEENNVLRNITLSDFTEHEDWWYSTIPTGIKTVEKNTPAMWVVKEADLNPVIEYIPAFSKPSSLYVILEGDDDAQYINNKYNQQLLTTTIKLEGYAVDGEYIEEEFSFALPGYYRTKYEYAKINRVISTAYDAPNKFRLTIGSHPQVRADYTIRHEDAVTITDADNDLRLIYWDFSGGTLQLKRIVAPDAYHYHADSRLIDTLKEYQLKGFGDGGLEDLTSVTSIIPSDINDLIYVLHEDRILCYSKNEEYPAIVKRASQLYTPDPSVKLNVIEEKGLLKIKGVYSNISLTSKIKKYRFILNEELMYDEATSSWIPLDLNTWTTYTLQDYKGFKSPELQYGDGTAFENDNMLIMEIMLQDGTIERDIKVISKQIKNPIFSYAIPFISNPVALGLSADGYLTVANETELMKLRFRNDTYIVDDKRNLIILAEGYDGKVVKNGIETNLTPFNVFNELDQWGAILACERFLGENNLSYLKRLNDASRHQGDASYRGMIYGLTRDLGLKIENAIKVTSTVSVRIKIKNPYIEVYYYDTDATIKGDLTGTVGSIAAFINHCPNVSAEVLTWEDMPAGVLIDSSSEYYVKGVRGTGSSVYELPLPYSWELVPGSVAVEGFKESISGDEAEAVYQLRGTSIVCNRKLEYDNAISYRIRQIEPILKATPVILTSLHNAVDKHFTADGISPLAREVIMEISAINPTKWSQ